MKCKAGKRVDGLCRKMPKGVRKYMLEEFYWYQKNDAGIWINAFFFGRVHPFLSDKIRFFFEILSEKERNQCFNTVFNHFKTFFLDVT